MATLREALGDQQSGLETGARTSEQKAESPRQLLTTGDGVKSRTSLYRSLANNLEACTRGEPDWMRYGEVYKHDALNLEQGQVRLLRVLPRWQASAIQCKLKTFDHDNCPPYQALSYVWGSNSETEIIHVNGRQLVVHRNLWDFLDRLSLDSFVNVDSKLLPYSLWINQICIYYVPSLTVWLSILRLMPLFRKVVAARREKHSAK
jgi:hypothetical protein